MKTGRSTHINPLGFFTDLSQHRELLWQFTVRNFKLTLRGSHLGMIWSLLNPLLMLGLYVFVFGFIFGGHFGAIPHETRVDYALGVFLSLTFFNLIAEVICISPIIITGNPNFVKKVVFPLEILPAAQVGASICRMCISLSLVLIGIIFLGPGPSTGLLWLPVIVVPLILMCFGSAWLISALGVFIQDINQLMIFLAQVIMYASAVFYPVHLIPHSAWMFLRFNPILLAVVQARDAALWGLGVNYTNLITLYVTSMIFCIIGYVVFKKLKPAFADVI